MARISFHIRDGANPEWCYQYLDILDQYPDASSGKEVYELAEEFGYEVGYQTEREVPTVLKKMGVLETATTRTERGEQLVEVMYHDIRLFKNILHHLFYTRDRIDAAEGVPPKNREMSSWTYGAVVDYLIDNSPVNPVSTKKSREEIAEAIFEQAQEELTSIRDEVSIGPRSISGAFQYLRELSPPVIEEGQHTNNEMEEKFQIRSFAPAEMLLVAIDFLYQESNTDYGTALILNNENIETLCRILVLDESGFDEVLEWAREFDHLEVSTGMAKQVRLSDPVNYHDLI
ncbi:hypothetical protein [Halogeometricum limi]|uniref:Uncharacterized protein n=1 Tax=Halogeometricum limi TaxID=555875 RepID=A0A1I6HV69_9EURY|nr:hypothetical protein [Halogeometricum limi]SFR58341.1 hypothetical protein SAMN04488124_2499 [Halogeometricum limi]